MKFIQEGIVSTQNNDHPAENTSGITKEQMYYTLVSEIFEKPDLVFETHWVNKPRQLHYVHQHMRFSEWKLYEMRSRQK